MAAPPRLVLVIIAVKQLARAAAFYRAAFGWKQTVDAPSYVELELPGGMRVGLYQREGFGVNTGQVPHAIPDGALAPAELYLHVDDFDATFARLEAAGARRLSPLAPRDWGDEVAYYADPDGNVLALARPLGH